MEVHLRNRALTHDDARPLRVLLRRPLQVGMAALTMVAITTLGLAILVIAVLGPRVDRADDMLSAVQDGHAAMLNQETGLRGFLVTREIRFLQPYWKGVNDLRLSDAELHRLGQEDPALVEHIDELTAAQQRFITEFVTPTLAAQPAIGDTAALSQLLRQDKFLFDRYRDVQVYVRGVVEERRELASDQMYMVLAGGALAGLLVAVGVALAVRRANRRLAAELLPPTQRVRDTLAALAAGDLDGRAPETGPAELRDIAVDVNALGDALHERGELVAARERELMAARDVAERAGQAKTAFLATMSHEIRTPLNAVLGLTDLLLTTQLTDEQRSHLETVSRSGDSLLTLINDILDFSKIEAGELDLEQAPFELDGLVYDVAQLLAPQAAGKGLDLLVDMSGERPWRMVGDGARLRQVVMNLVGNAVKFTSAGQVVVTVTADDLGDGAVLCRLAVTDTGIGITDEQRERLFRSFSQGDASITRSYGGTGLGLAISARLAEAMGGTIAVDSEPGAGSTFTVTVRLTEGTAPAVPGASADLSGRRLLVVDDNPTNLRILEHKLDRFGATCVLVGSGAEALALFDEGERFDAVVLDLHMPGMPGDELAARLRAHPGAAGVPLVLLSSSARLHANGTAAFAARLHKPVRPDRLLTTLVSVLRPEECPRPAAHADGVAPPARPARRLRVLIAEDHAVNAHLIGLYLRQLGHDGEHVVNGALAVEAVRRGDHDLVLMDAQMPVMGGVDATRAIRALPGAQPRIIAVTASVLASDRSAFMAAGADDFLSKPVRLATLQTALERWLPAPDEQPASPPSLPVPRDGAEADDVLDADTVEELRDLGADAFAHLYTSYVGSLLDSVEAILAAAAGSSWSEDDETSVPRLAHRLKGSSAAMGAGRLAELCQLLQTASAPSADADRALAALREEGSRVRGAVTALLSTGE